LSLSSVDLAKSATTCVRQCASVAAGEHVLIVTDFRSDQEVIAALGAAVVSCGAVPTVAIMPVTRWAGDDPTPPIAHALDGADVVIALTHLSLGHSRQFTERLERGVFRFVSCPGVTGAQMVAGACAADYAEVFSIGDTIRNIIEGHRTIKITTALGTDLDADFVGMPIRHEHGAQEPGDVACFPGGEVWQAPREGSAHGVVVVDVTASMLGRIQEPITLTIEEGAVRSIAGGSQADELRRIIDGVENAVNIAEISIGTNRWARTTGNVSEDKKLLGSVHIALGDNRMLGGSTASPIHLDGVISRPTVRVDELEIVRDGVVQLPDD
jgi:leucyl aminopeptidase (aminopeptidase T)